MERVVGSHLVICATQKGKYFVYVMKNKVDSDGFEFCSVCEEENGNEILAEWEVDQITILPLASGDVNLHGIYREGYEENRKR
jgi:hypothetical protein